MPTITKAKKPVKNWTVYKSTKKHYVGEPQLRFNNVIVAVFPTMGGQWATCQSRAEAERLAARIKKLLNESGMKIRLTPFCTRR